MPAFGTQDLQSELMRKPFFVGEENNYTFNPMDGAMFDSAELTEDPTWGSKWLKPGVACFWDNAAGKLKIWDNENDTPTEVFAGLVYQDIDLSTGDKIIRLVTGGKVSAEQIYIKDTGGTPTELSGDAAVTKLKAHINAYEAATGVHPCARLEFVQPLS